MTRPNGGTPSSTSPRTWQLRIFGATWIAYAGVYLCRKNFGVVMPILQTEVGLTKPELANIIAAFSICYCLGQLLGGSLVDRFSARATVTWSLAGVVLWNAGMGLTGTFVALFVLSCLNGLSQALGWPGLVKTMSEWFPVRTRGSVMGWWTTNYVAGGLLATLFATYVVSHPVFLADWVWQRGFWAPAAVLAIIAAVYPWAVRNKPRDAGLAEVAPESGDGRAPLAFSSLRVSLSEPIVVVAGTIGALLKYTRYSLLFWLPLYMVEHLHYSVERAGYTSSVFEVAGFAGSLFAGYASDRLNNGRRFPVITVMQVCLAGACFFHPLVAGESFWANALGIGLMGFALYGPDTLVQGAVAQDIGAKSGVGATAGFISGSSAIGQVVSPVLVAWFSSRFGWNAVFRSFAVAAILGALLARYYWRFSVESRPDANVVRQKS